MPQSQDIRFVWYKQANVPGSVKKLNILARQVRGLSAAEAMAQMTFDVKRRAPTMRYAIQRAVRRAEDRFDLFADDLIVHECTAEIQRQEARMRYHARGRFGLSHMRRSRVRVVLREAFPEEKAALNKFTAEKARPVTTEMRSPRNY
ncbi:hypothetical protein FNF27_04212 [Cafeteria roenbergensis]|nr:hypothetical protein FNF28_04516 [Cafeteria roenbergensis]KAA0166756.1 hypothetical protein FNF31_01131 [Cafeteria roenbergensis]KAA0174200.1 hypothetical protein FNF27_04212 [Cafeteria roenbergensis]